MQGTGTWSTKEIAERHVAAPTIAAAHQLRIISAERDERLEVVKNLKMPQPCKSERKVDDALLKTVEKAVYGCILGAFVQGLEVSHMLTALMIDYRQSVDRAKVGRQPGQLHEDLAGGVYHPVWSVAQRTLWSSELIDRCNLRASLAPARAIWPVCSAQPRTRHPKGRSRASIDL